jgi:hypothetical protein
MKEMRKVLEALAKSSGGTTLPLLIGRFGCRREAVNQCRDRNYVGVSKENVWGSEIMHVYITENGRKALASAGE